MEFNKYIHLERWGTEHVEGIEHGQTHIFPKLDGTNASVWLQDGVVRAGSRNRVLSLENDNAGFYGYVTSGAKAQNFRDYSEANPEHILYGEWLVPHTLKTYREDAWRRFYVFDVMVDGHFLHYDTYKPLMDEFGFDYIPCFVIANSINYDTLLEVLKKNTLYIEEGKGSGEGIVLKNYAYYNKHGNQIWAKIITDDFKVQHYQEMGPNEIGGMMLEEVVVNKYVTQHLIDKVIAKIVLETGGWQSQYIPRLLQTVWYDLITEEMWNITKEYKNPLINFTVLNRFTISKIKKLATGVF